MFDAVKIFPRPVGPKSAMADILAYLAGPLPHKWPLLGVSIALTGVMVWALFEDSKKPPAPREIIYIQSWMADRKDSDILLQQKKDLARYEAALEREQRKFQTVADQFGLEWREDAARNKAQRLAVIAAVNKRLDEKIAQAKAKEAAAAASGEAPRQ